MINITTKQRAYLRSLATHIDTIMQIGKGGVGDAMVKTVCDALEARELIKMKVLENSQYNAAEAAEILCEEIGCESVQIIGSKFVLFQQKKKDSKFDLKNLCLL